MSKFDSTLIDAVNEAFAAAQNATQETLNKHGDRDVCGFAWVTIRPGNGKLARYLKHIGEARPAYGGGLSVWNPGKSFTQALTAKEDGAQAFARVLRDKLGLGYKEVSAGSRMD
jgi:hypothetical protein